MSNKTKQIEQGKTTDFLKEEYTKRIDEVDNFSKRIFNMYGQISTEFLYGYLNIIQHSLELQNNVPNPYANQIDLQFMTGIVKQNTDTWIRFLQNIDTAYIESLKNLKNNMRTMNSNSVSYIQSVERGYVSFKNIQPNIKNKQESETLENQSVSQEIKTKNQQ
jgi:uncharacterized protein YutE (UPF0331/DUF86 family)